MIDLHNHTTASDGALSAAALVERAHGLGIRVMAVTDHDTVAALPAARVAAERLGVRLLAGVEISATHDGGSLHVLGYLFDETHLALRDTLAKLIGGRDARNLTIVRKLTDLGMPLTIDEVRARADGTVGRPHFAAAMMARGYVGSVQEAFERWLKDGRPAFVDKEVLTPAEAIDVIHDAGGIAVLAHPLTYGRSADKIEPLIRSLAADRIDGIEVDYGPYSAGERGMLRCFADRYSLLATGGSDFHRDPCPVAPAIDAALIDAMQLRAAAYG